MTASARHESHLARTCPNCGALPPPDREVASEPRGERLDAERLTAFWIGLLKQKVFFSYARCPACRLLYAPTYFNEAQLAGLYARMPPNMDMVPSAALRATQRGYFDVLRRAAPLTGSYLEVGPDAGLFAENCVRAGAFDHYWLLEPNRDVAPRLKAAMGAAPHAIIESMFGFDAVPDGSVRAAVMIHVLDHLIEPAETLAAIARKLAPGGVILVVTHNERSLLRRMIGCNWPPFCLQHPQLFNPRTLSSMLERAGFTGVKVARSLNYFPLSFLLTQGLWALGIKAPRLPQFLAIAIGLKLGNMIVVARK